MGFKSILWTNRYISKRARNKKLATLADAWLGCLGPPPAANISSFFLFKTKENAENVLKREFAKIFCEIFVRVSVRNLRHILQKNVKIFKLLF